MRMIKGAALFGLAALMLAGSPDAQARPETGTPRGVQPVRLYEDNFLAILFSVQSSRYDRYVVIEHSGTFYSGTLASMSFADRTQAVVNMAASIIAQDCGGPDRVAAYGDMELTSDPEFAPDPLGSEPRRIAWIYTCK